jgi:YbbR domain-containing protein
MTTKTISIPVEDYKKLKNTVSISQYEYERLCETIEVLGDSETIEEIKECRKQIKEGKFKTLKQLKSEL